MTIVPSLQHGITKADFSGIIQDQLTGPCVAAPRLMRASDALGRSFDVDMPMQKQVA